MEIVYCGGCGKLLRGDDFDRGLARFLDNRPWCHECRPPEKDPVPAAPRRQGSSAKHARVGTTRREQVPASGSRKGVALVIAAVVLLLVGLYLGGRSSEPPPVTVERSIKPPVDPGRKTPDGGDAERLLKELESFASLSPPDKVLARCEELAPKFQGAPQERRFREIETAARDQKRQREQELQLGKDLEELRKITDEDQRFARYDEVVRRLKAAREIAGARASEIDRRLADYQKARQESPHEKHVGPFKPDDEGFIRNWLVLGVFSNANDKGGDTDYLQTEAAHEPAAGLQVDKAKWAAYASPDGHVDFFAVPHLGIRKPRDYVVAYAACLLQTGEHVASEFRLGSDDGIYLWVDGQPIYRHHKGRKYTPDEDRHAVPLPPGVHRVLIKVENHGGEFEFGLRIVTPDGKPVPSLRIWN